MRMQIPFIASIGYKKQIDQFCLKLKEHTGLDYFVAYIVFNNGEKFVLSNIYHILKPYYQESYYQKDFSIRENVIQNKDFYLCDQLPSVSTDFASILENRFSVFRVFYTIRRSLECTLVFGGAMMRQCSDTLQFYEHSKEDFNQFCLTFMRSALPIIKLHNPQYHRALLFNDENYLKNVILNRTCKKVSLSNREVECLIWAANGKTSEDTALILNVSVDTVNHHRRSVLSKLSCKTLTQAIYKALCLGYLGNLNSLVKQVKDDDRTGPLKEYKNVIVTV